METKPTTAEVERVPRGSAHPGTTLARVLWQYLLSFRKTTTTVSEKKFSDVITELRILLKQIQTKAVVH